MRDLYMRDQYLNTEPAVQAPVGLALVAALRSLLTQ
jgi:hypothetical protein